MKSKVSRAIVYFDAKYVPERDTWQCAYRLYYIQRPTGWQKERALFAGTEEACKAWIAARDLHMERDVRWRDGAVRMVPYIARD